MLYTIKNDDFFWNWVFDVFQCGTYSSYDITKDNAENEINYSIITYWIKYCLIDFHIIQDFNWLLSQNFSYMNLQKGLYRF